MLNTAKTLYTILNKIAPTFPVVVTKEQYPCIVYNRTSLTPNYTKDLLTMDKATFEIDVYTKDYTQGIDIAQAIREAIECKKIGKYTVYINNITENYSDDIYVQQIEIRL